MAIGDRPELACTALFASLANALYRAVVKKIFAHAPIQLVWTMFAAPTPGQSELLTPHGTTLAAMLRAAEAAGQAVLRYFREGKATTAWIERKPGGSPVTQADMLANDMLRTHLCEGFPGAAWMSEEEPDNLARLASRDLLVIDPIDGTRAFVAGDPRFAISVALVRDGRSIAGVLHAPALRLTFAALAGQGAWLNGKPLNLPKHMSRGEIRAAGPKPMLDELGRRGLTIAAQARIPSLALRLAHVADGALHVALASANSHDWDIAAVDVILRESGASLSNLTGDIPIYNLRNTVHGPLIAAPNALHGQLTHRGAKQMSAVAEI